MKHGFLLSPAWIPHFVTAELMMQLFLHYFEPNPPTQLSTFTKFIRN